VARNTADLVVVTLVTRKRCENGTVKEEVHHNALAAFAE
jgi:hypothetical protein